MPATSNAPPVDVSSCDREPIHTPGTIQDIGFLIAVSTEWRICHVSANIERYLGKTTDALIGEKLNRFFSADLLHDIRGRLQMLGANDPVERLFAIPLHDQGEPYDIAVHYTNGLIVIEGEPSGEDRRFDGMAAVKGMMSRLHRLDRDSDMLEVAARQMRALLGFGRVMVYKFDHDGSGEVVAESVQGGMASFKGLRFPASDIPQQARALYARNWLRLISDVDRRPVPIVPTLSPDGAPLDLSFSALRSVSPIHLEYLRNMGVAASMSISIMRRNRLWGLFACHHASPRNISFQRRASAELLGQLFSLHLESREDQRAREYEVVTRRTHDQILSALSHEGSLADNLNGMAEQIRSLIPCDGVAICVDGCTTLHGRTPARDELLGLLRFLGKHGANARIEVSAELARLYPPAEDFPERAAGMLAIPISRNKRDYLLFFRAELPEHVTWAGDPNKPAQMGPNGIRLTPRKSFEAWREVVRGRSAPWTDTEQQIAESLRVTLLEIIVRLSGAAEEQRRVANARQDLLIAELNHRVRNILGLIRALVARSRESASSLENFVQVLSDRIFALSEAHDLLTADQWRPISLRTLLQRELNAYLGRENLRVTMDGPPVLIAPQAFSVLALVLHELTTNAAKYGALSDRHGRVEIRWTLDDFDALVLHWREFDGPMVRAPMRQGFGTTIIERSIPFELEGEADIRYELDGLQARFVLPQRFVEQGSTEHDAVVEPVLKTPARRFNGQAMVVEDNALIAFDTEQILRRLGFEQVEVCSTIDQALAFMERRPNIALILLDVNLGSTTSMPVAIEAKRLGIPFLFASGYGEQLRLPPELEGATIISKPFREETVERAAFQLLQPSA